VAVYSGKIKFGTTGNTDIIEITGLLSKAVKDSSIRNGLLNVFVPGATGALTTIEYEPGLVADLKAFFTRVLPETGIYNHNLTHPDSNGHSHIRASLIGPSITIPVIDSKMNLGVWQQVIFIDFDNIPRDRELVVQMVGEK